MQCHLRDIGQYHYARVSLLRRKTLETITGFDFANNRNESVWFSVLAVGFYEFPLLITTRKLCNKSLHCLLAVYMLQS